MGFIRTIMLFGFIQEMETSLLTVMTEASESQEIEEKPGYSMRSFRLDSSIISTWIMIFPIMSWGACRTMEAGEDLLIHGWEVVSRIIIGKIYGVEMGSTLCLIQTM